MHDGQGEREAALAELCERLADGLARARLTKTQLAQRAGLGRTTVQQAFQKDASAPSAATVAALARVLRLPEGKLLALRRTAAGEDGPRAVAGEDQGPGRPITEWDPHDLEVHPADTTPDADPASGQVTGPASRRVLPGYVRRDHDEALDQAVQDVVKGHSRMLVLVGASSTGKTRACWEAVQPLASAGWRLWHPFDPTRTHAALEQLQHVQPYTVVWLNEAQHYLGDTRLGEQIAAAVHHLLTGPDRAPVLVLGTAARHPTFPGRVRVGSRHVWLRGRSAADRRPELSRGFPGKPSWQETQKGLASRSRNGSLIDTTPSTA